MNIFLEHFQLFLLSFNNFCLVFRMDIEVLFGKSFSFTLLLFHRNLQIFWKFTENVLIRLNELTFQKRTSSKISSKMFPKTPIHLAEYSDYTELSSCKLHNLMRLDLAGSRDIISLPWITHGFLSRRKFIVPT